MFNPFLVLDNFISLVGHCHRLRGAQQPTKCSRSQCESCCRGRVAVETSASSEGYPKVRRLKAATTAFTFNTLLRHYAKRALTPRSLNVKLGPRLKKGGYKTCAKAESPLLPPAARITLNTHRASRWTRAAYLNNKICISFT